MRKATGKPAAALPALEFAGGGFAQVPAGADPDHDANQLVGAQAAQNAPHRARASREA